MNKLGLAFLIAGVQVSLMALPATFLVVLVARRHARSAAALALTAIGLSAGLWITAIGPIPPWRNLIALAQVAPSSQPESTSPIPTAAQSRHSRWNWTLGLGSLTEHLPAKVSDDKHEMTSSSVWSVLAVIVFTAIFISATRFALALRALVRLRRNSHAIQNDQLARLCHSIQQLLGCRRTVELRTCSAVSSAAVFGWRKPIILLPENWREWPVEDLRAVLAHELAHVHHGDFAATLFAAFCLVAQGCHPLVMWLGRRLRAEQELAADALAATVAGGRSNYLLSLARVALRSESAQALGLARSFLNDGSTLLRRIAMLRVTDDHRRGSRRVLWGLQAVLVAIAVAASAMHGPAQTPPSVPSEVKHLPQFDLSAVPKQSRMFIALRPAEMTRIPGMERLVEKLQQNFHEAFTAFKLSAFVFPFKEIEQIIFYAETRSGKPGDSFFTTDSIALIRMTRDYDWPGRVKAMRPAVSVNEPKPNQFKVEAAGFGPSPFSFRVADARTLVFTDGGDHDPTPAITRWGPAAGPFNSSCIVVGLDNRDGSMAKLLTTHPRHKDAAGLSELLAVSTHVALAVDNAESVGGSLIADCRSQADGAKAKDALNSFGIFARSASSAALAENEQLAPAARFWFEVLQDITQRRPIEQEGNQVRTIGLSKAHFADAFRRSVPIFDDSDAPREKK